jgi:hypothetical protein
VESFPQLVAQPHLLVDTQFTLFLLHNLAPHLFLVELALLSI